MEAESGNVSLDPLLDRESFAGVFADDEDGVVACDGAYDFRPLFVIDCGGDGLGSAGAGDDDDEICGLAGLEAEILQNLMNRRLVVVLIFVATAGEDVAVGAFGEPQFVDVAGEGGLSDVVALGGEFAAQFILIGDGRLHQQVADGAVSIALQKKTFRQ